jgi:hypothetical protein
MAINTSNSNIISITNLPQTQEAVNGDLLIIQTDNGLQAIDFENFNAVKTDASGNATVVGSLSGTNCYFTNVNALCTISSLNYVSNNQSGIFAPNDYYNRLTINGGIVTSASYILGSPEYQYINDTVLPTLTAFQNTLYKIVVDESSTDPGQNLVTVLANNASQQYFLAGFFSRNPNVSPGSIQPQHFTLMTTSQLSAYPYVSNVVNDGLNGLTFTVNTGYRVPQDTSFYWRLLYTYTTTV